MVFIADLHVHSYLSRATSKLSNLENMHRWAQLKGITVVGTGDFTHPVWLSELKEKLEPAENGLFSLKEDLARPIQREIPPRCEGPVRFMLTVEISNIYKKKGRTRKVHNLVCVPDFQAAESLIQALEKIGNLRSDGRPILGLDSRDLLEMVLASSDQSCLIPAHIWTPWFSALGSKSGFDSIEECYEDLTEHIFAVETGLSSDPPMNWRVSTLDRFTLVSNSDAHSSEKLGREANIFDTEPGFREMMEALRGGAASGRFLGTIEFFPEEGKYHFDGHRKCMARMDPEETMGKKGLCPVCGKSVTLGVLYRVLELADRREGKRPAGALPYRRLLTLPAVLGQVHNQGAGTKKVMRDYHYLLRELGPELAILRHTPLDDLEKAGSPLLREGIKRVREESVTIDAGYDGEYGAIHLFTPEDRKAISDQQSLFQLKARGAGKEIRKQKRIARKQPAEFKTRKKPEKKKGADRTIPEEPLLNRLNPEQKSAVQKKDVPLLIIAGPGTGKTRTLTARIVYRILEHGIPPGEILAVTFTNKAAEEMKERLEKQLSGMVQKEDLLVCTFHALCYRILSETGFPPGSGRKPEIIHDRDAATLLAFAALKTGSPEYLEKHLRDVRKSLESAVLNLVHPDDARRCFRNPDHVKFFRPYLEMQQDMHLLDYDSLLYHTVFLLSGNADILDRYRAGFHYIFVDEYQDINPAQYGLIKLLAGDGKQLSAIGDPDQAIYGFRGARTDYFRAFSTDFPGAEVLSLARNYRSSETILRAAGQLMQGNCESGKIWSGIEGRKHLEICPLQSEKAEAEFIVHTIESMVGGTRFFSLDSGRVREEEDARKDYSFRDFAVLYRTHQLGEAVEEAFLRAGIPFQRKRGRHFSEKPPVASLLYFLQILDNPLNTFALFQSLRSPTVGLPAARAETIRQQAFEKKLSAPDAVQWGRRHLLLSAKEDRALEKLEKMLLSLEPGLHSPDLEKLVIMAMEAISFSSLYRDGGEGPEEDMQVLKDCARIVKKGIGPFIAYLNLQGEVDTYNFQAEKVSLMTLHASKGLEFPVVFIAACEEGILPLSGWLGKSGDPAEERRLFYVGLTRAAECIYLTYSLFRSIAGERKAQNPSPFIADIERELTRVFDTAYGKKKKSGKNGAEQMSLF